MLIVETEHRLRRWAWVEARLFEVVGGWASSTPEHDVARWLATAAHHHAWRSSLWRERLPVLHDIPTSEPPSGWAALLDAAGGAASTGARLAGLGEVVLPALVEEYEAALATAAEVADGPVARGLRLAIPDAHEDRRSAVALLAIAPDDVLVADHRSSLLALRGGLTAD